MNKQLATPALFLGLMATGLFVWVDMFRYGYPPKITLLTVPYAFSGLALSMALYHSIAGGYWLHSGLFVAGLIVNCALV